MKFQHQNTAPMNSAAAAFDALPDVAFVRLRDFTRRPGQPGIVPVSASSVWRMVASGKFPKPTKLGEKTTVWNVGEIRAWLAQQMPQAQAQ